MEIRRYLVPLAVFLFTAITYSEVTSMVTDLKEEVTEERKRIEKELEEFKDSRDKHYSLFFTYASKTSIVERFYTNVLFNRYVYSKQYNGQNKVALYILYCSFKSDIG